jgi:hypothetical protein
MRNIDVFPLQFFSRHSSKEVGSMCADEGYLATGTSGGHSGIRTTTTTIEIELGGQDTFSQGWDGVAREHQVGVITANYDNFKGRKRMRAGHLRIRCGSPTPFSN